MNTPTRVSIGGKVPEELKQKFEATAKARGLTNTELMNICLMSSFNVLEDGILQEKDKEAIRQIIIEELENKGEIAPIPDPPPSNEGEPIEEPIEPLTEKELYEEQKALVYGRLPKMLRNEYISLINEAYSERDKSIKTWQRFELLADLLSENEQEPLERRTNVNFNFERTASLDNCRELLNITKDAIGEMGNNIDKITFYNIVSRWLHESVKSHFEEENVFWFMFNRYEHGLLSRLMTMENRSRSDKSQIKDLEGYFKYLAGKEAKRKAEKSLFSSDRELKELGNKLIEEAIGV